MCFLKRNGDILYLTENLHNFGADIGEIIYLPTLNPHNPSNALFSFFERVDHSNVELLDNQLNGFKQSYEQYHSCAVDDRKEFGFEFIIDLHCTSESAFLIEVLLVQDIDQLILDYHSEIIGYEGDLSLKKSLWIFAESMECALQQGINLGHENLLKFQKKQSMSVGVG